MVNLVVESSPLASSFVITSYYGRRTSTSSVVSTDHKGIDLGVYGNPNGVIPVLAVSSGRVTLASWVGGYGNVVYLDHGDGITTRYAHLHSIAVSVGTVVSGGDILGLMGSTGNSTGPHLHFEVRENDNPIDPEPYIHGKSVITNTILSNFYTPANYDSAENIPYNPSQVVGRRVSDISKQPLHAYLRIFIGDTLLSTSPPKPNIIQNFEINRLKGAGDTASFTIFDDNWEEIEKTFSDNWNNISIDYGYSESNLKSDRFNMLLQNYSVSFNSTGAILSISAISQGQYKNIAATTIITDSRNPTVAIKMICNSIGLTVIDSNFDETKTVTDAANPFNVINDYPITYIMNNIVPYAQTLNGEVLNFYVDSENVAYFKEQTYLPDSPSSDVKTYIYQKGYDSVVEDLTFDIKGVFGGTTQFGIASGLKSSVFDPITKEQSSYEATTSSTVTEATGDKQSISSSQSIPSVDSAAYTETQMKNKLYYYIKNSTSEMYEATMTIVGDPTIKLFERVRIINMTDKGYLHHTSGIYIVKGIIDSINGGVMTTTLKLQRNGDINQGVELINPKYIVK